jgi:hypothetical protein
MAVKLKFERDELFLGKTRMGQVIKHSDGMYRYHLGPDDHVSDPYESPEDARQDCLSHVRRLVKSAGADA